MRKDIRTQAMSAFLQKQKIATMDQLIAATVSNEWTIRRDLKQLKAITSYTHSGRYVTLPEIPKFDENGIWFYREIGFSKYKNSLELIVQIVNSGNKGLTREDIQKIIKIQIFQQISVLLRRNMIFRVKKGSKYVYIPEKTVTNKKSRQEIVGSLQTEEYYDREIKIIDLIAVLKIVLQEGKIDFSSVKEWVKKYALKIPLTKLEALILKHKLNEKKTL